MKRLINTQTLAGGALAAILLAVGAAAASYANNSQQAEVVPVTYSVNAAPAVTPQEAARAVASAKDLSTAFRVASELVLPSVVTIETTPKAVASSDAPRRQPNPGGDRNPFEGTPFEDFFKDRGFNFQMPPSQPMPRGKGMGSGVVIDSSGIILTNNHVVAGDGEVTVRLSDGREFTATDVWTDPKTDIAVVKIDATGLVAAQLGDSDAVAVGDWVLALGQPFGLESTVTAGIISGKHRGGMGITARESFLQTDAAINPGNSGGPLVNLDGQVVGINTAISSRGGGNDGVGFAVPINLAKWVGNQLAHGGTVRRAYLGVGIQPVTATLAEQLQVRPREGVAVTEVFADTPAAKAGLQSSDVIVEYAGVAISSPSELQILVERSELDKPHLLTVVRDGKRINLNFTPERQPGDFGSVATSQERVTPQPASSRLERLGLEVSSLDAAVAAQLGIQDVEGVVITNVESGSPAARAGLSSGMVITQVNRQPVTSPDELASIVKQSESSDGFLLLVRSQRGSRFVVIE